MMNEKGLEEMNEVLVHNRSTLKSHAPPRQIQRLGDCRSDTAP